jgi:hypothetical protein
MIWSQKPVEQLPLWKPTVPPASTSQRNPKIPRQMPSGTSQMQNVPSKVEQVQHPLVPEQKPPPGPRLMQSWPAGHSRTHVPLEQHDPGGHGFSGEQVQFAARARGAAVHVVLLGLQVVPGSQHVSPPVPRHGVRPAGQPQMP